MQKIILSDKTLGLLIGWLKNFFAGDVVEVEHDDSISPKDLVRLPAKLEVSDWWIAMVTRHWMMNDPLRVRKGQPRTMIHVSHTEACATFFKEGDEFYFFGTRNIVVRRVNSSTEWDNEGKNIPTLSRFILKRTRHEMTDQDHEIKIQQLEGSFQFNRDFEEQTMRLDMEEMFGIGRYARRGSGNDRSEAHA